MLNIFICVEYGTMKGLIVILYLHILNKLDTFHCLNGNFCDIQLVKFIFMRCTQNLGNKNYTDYPLGSSIQREKYLILTAHRERVKHLHTPKHTHPYTCIHTYSYMPTYTHIHSHIHIHTCIHTHTHVQAYSRGDANIHTHAFTYTHSHKYTNSLTQIHKHV